MHITTLAERPELLTAWWDMPTSWPAFMFEDRVADRLLRHVPHHWPQLQIVILDGEPIEPVAVLRCAAFCWNGDEATLPATGWDGILQICIDHHEAGRAPNAVTLLEAAVRPDHQGRGLSTDLLKAARDRCAALGFTDLFGPVRPSQKSRYPRTPMAGYVARRRDDGLPLDPWLRVHVRMGGRIVKICPLSMTITGTPQQWREWTGVPFEVTGDVEVPQALTPVHLDVEAGHAVYVEPNVWVRHALTAVRR